MCIGGSATGTALVLRSGALGDFVLALPVFDVLRAARPARRVVFAGRSEFGRLALRAGLVDEVLSDDAPEIVSLFSTSADALDQGRSPWQPPPGRPTGGAAWGAGSCRRRRTVLHEALARSPGSVDLAVSFVSSDVVTRNLIATGAGEVVSCSPPTGGSPRPSAGGRTHAADRLLSALRGRFDVPSRAVPSLPVPEDMRDRARRALAERGVAPGSFLAVHPGSGSARKNWPAERFVDLARAAREGLGLGVVVLTGPAEAERGDASVGALARSADAAFESPRLTLLEGVLAEARAYVGNDSGVTHLAAACGCPVVAVFGPTDPAVWAPRGRRVAVVRDPSGELEPVPVAEVLGALGKVTAGPGGGPGTRP